jgi:predicted MFS family arabinose efflux permease
VTTQRATAVAFAATGMAALAIAMGVGRFAFTPILPLMQQEGMALRDGAFLATANYAGYLAGALLSFTKLPGSARAVRSGLMGVAVTTVAMSLAEALWSLATLRFLAGIASAFVLIGVSSSTPAALAAVGHQNLVGWVFSGVGVGIALTGLAAGASAGLGGSARDAWLSLGAVALVVTIWVARRWGNNYVGRASSVTSDARRLRLHEWILVLAYGGFGFGYIIPATFLPAMARSLANDPSLFGWAWPIFGAAAAMSTVVVARWASGQAPRHIYTVSILVMAVGVALPVVSRSMLAITLSAVCVGSTFVVATMAGLQEARRIVGGSPERIISAMTAAFAIGQLTGPALVGLYAEAQDPIMVPSVLAVCVLVSSALALQVHRTRRFQLPGR